LKSPLVNSCAHRHDLGSNRTGIASHAIKSELLNVLYNTGTGDAPIALAAQNAGPRNDFAHMKGLVMKLSPHLKPDNAVNPHHLCR
jgi:hypothetical protein